MSFLECLIELLVHKLKKIHTFYCFPYLTNSDRNNSLGVEHRGRRDQQVQTRRQEDGRAEEPVGRELGCQEAAGQLGHNVAPEEGRVHVADGLGAPVELGDLGDLALGVGLVGHHGDRGDAHVASDAEGDDEPDHDE